MKFLGHSDVATTSTFYADVLVEGIRAAMEATADDVAARRQHGDQSTAPTRRNVD